MKKLFVLLLLTLGLTNTSFGISLDKWPHDNLCGCMESSSIPRHVLDEAVKREILCYGGIEVSTFPESAPDTSSVYLY